MNDRPHILLLGGRGQIGWELRRTLSGLGHLTIMNSQSLNLANLDGLQQKIRELVPTVIINSAAYAQVDMAESDVLEARLINATVPGILSKEATKLDALLIHFSTDYVFNGSGHQSWSEGDDCDPVNVYGETKLLGEREIQLSGCRHLIFRTSWVYGARGKNFLLTMRKLMQEKPELKIVADQIGAPTWCRDLAEATALVLSQLHSPSALWRDSEPWGIYHMCNAGAVSWHGFAEAIREHAVMNHQSVTARLLPILSSEYPTPARRPLNSRLNCDKLEQTFGLRLQDWQTALALCLDDMDGKN